MTANNTITCDKCGRSIPYYKNYENIGGWIICGMCEYEMDMQRQKLPVYGPSKDNPPKPYDIFGNVKVKEKP
ncbi:MAG: hypothetical protein M0P47_09390 [Bacteroidales bacterium]|nr:hypothetical protein [Bacteroidales bacterium]